MSLESVRSLQFGHPDAMGPLLYDLAIQGDNSFSFMYYLAWTDNYGREDHDTFYRNELEFELSALFGSTRP